MSIIGAPTHWAGLIDPMVPVILRLVVESWESVYAFGSDEREDNITVALCRIVKWTPLSRPKFGLDKL
jgi:hypothetical protein